MPNPSDKKPSNLLKIGQAAQALGVSIDTLRRWEKKGKIKTVKTPGGTRFYSIETLKKINPEVEDFHASNLTTEELLENTKNQKQLISSSTIHSSYVIPANAGIQLENSSSELDPDIRRDDDNGETQDHNFKKSFINKFFTGGALLLILSILLTTWIAAFYLVSPTTTKQFFTSPVSKILLPFNKLAQLSINVVFPDQAKQLGFGSSAEPPPKTMNYALRSKNSDVLAALASPQFLEINSDTQINGALAVRDSINGLTLEASPSANTFTATSGTTTLTVTKDALLDQDVSTAASPTFNSLNLSSTTNQLVLQSGGPTGTLTWTPTTAQIITFPNATGTVVLDSATQTLTNKTISGGSNTITNLPNSALSNSSITITAGSGLSGGGAVTLGGSITLSASAGTGAITSVSNSDGTLTISPTTGAVVASLNLTNANTWTGNQTFSGNVGIGGSLTASGVVCLGVDCRTTWPAGNAYTASNGITLSGFDFQLGGQLSADTKIDINSQNFGFFGGNVGIGTTTPQAALHVVGDTIVTGTITVGSCSGCSTLGGTVLLANGSATLPSLAFTNSTGSGLWRAGADLIAFTTSGGGALQAGTTINGLSINPSGNVGIGTTNPTYQLQTTGSVGIGGSLTATGTGVFNDGINVTGLSNLATVNASSLTTAGFQLTTGANTNYIMVSDAFGNGSWASSISGGFIANNSLDFQQFKDNMTLDASTDIATAGFNLTTSGNGNVAFNNTGSFTVSSPATFNSTINSNTFTSTALVLSGSGNVGIGATVAGTNLNLNPGANGLVNIAGGSGSTGCTIDDATGSLTCSGSIGVGSSSGQSGYWSRIGSTLSPAFSGDNITTIGNISATGNGSITSGGTLTAQNGLTMSTGALSLTSTSGTAALNLSLVTNAFNVNGNLFNIDTFNNRIGIGTSAPTSTLQVLGGNVGIGTSATGAALQVNGGAAIGFGPTAVSSYSTNGLIVSGNVGIGTSAPGTKLDIHGNTDGAFTGLRITNDNNGGTNNPSSLISLSTGPTYNPMTQIGGYQEAIGSGANGSLQLFTRQSDVMYERLRINSAGNIGIGTTSPAYKMDMYSTSSTGLDLRVYNNSLNTGNMAFLSSTSTQLTTGSLLALDWSPTGTSTIYSTGDLFSINVGQFGSVGNIFNLKDNGNSIFSVSQTAFTTSLPASFTAPGDVSVAYDINFTNPTASYIKSAAPLYITAGKIYNSSDLTLTTYNLGQILLNSANGVYAIGNVGIGVSYSGANLPSNGLAVQGNVGIGTSTANSKLTVVGNALIGNSYTGISAPTSGLLVEGNVGIGATTASNKFNVWGNTRLAGNLTLDANLLLSSYNCSAYSNNGKLTTDASGNVVCQADSAGSLTGGQINGVAFWDSTTTVSNSVANFYWNSTSNRLGIGTSNPGSTLQLNGNTALGWGSAPVVGPVNGLGVAGNVGIGTTTPSYKLDIYSTSTTGSDLRVRNDFLNTGNAVYLSSTSNTLSTGNLLALDWSPGISTTGTGDLFSINMGANALGSNLLNLKDNGTSIFSVSQTGVTIGLPTSFTSAGDVSLAYDLNFTNLTASYIKSAAPLYITAGRTYNSSDLVLQTYNFGNLILKPNTGNIWADGTNVGIGTTNPTSKFEVNGTGYFSGFVGIGSSLNTSGNVGVGGSLTVTSGANLNSLNVTGNTNLNTLGVQSTANFNSTVALNNLSAFAGTSLCINASNQVVTCSGGSALTGTGINGGVTYWTGSNTLSNSAANFYFDSSNNRLGIGTSNPFGQLQVGSGVTPALFVNNGNVGIGTTVGPFSGSSARKYLTIMGNTANGTLEFGTAQADANDVVLGLTQYTDINSTATDPRAALIAGWLDGTTANKRGGKITFHTRADNSDTMVLRMTLNNTGNLGIGFSSPDRLLQAASDISMTGTLATLLGTGGTQFSLTGSTASGLTDKLALGIDTTNHFGVIQAGNVSSAYSLALNPGGGNVGIGTTTPTDFKLQVAGDIGPTADNIYNLGSASLRWASAHIGPGSLVVHNDTTNTNWSKLDFAGNTAQLITDSATPLQLTTGINNLGMYINTTGNVGIGTTDTSAYNTAATGTFFTGGSSTGISINGSTIAGAIAPGLIGSGEYPVTINAPGTNSTHLTLQTQGLDRLYIDNGGNIGVGTISPLGQFDVRNALSSTALHMYVGSSAGQFSILNNGNVGIGTTAPVGLFQIGTSPTPGFIVMSNGNVGIGTTNPTSKFSIGGTSSTISNTAGNLTITPAANLIISGGNVGIGTTNPLAPLQVQGNNTISALFLNGNVGIGFSTPDRALQLASDINITGSLASILGAAGTQFSITGGTASNLQDKLAFGIDNTDHYGVIQAGNVSSAYNLALNPAGGNVGIGTTSPTALLSLSSAAGTSPQISFTNGTINGYVGIDNTGQSVDISANNAYSVRVETNGTERLRVDSAGNVGIGFSTPDRLLQAASDVAITSSLSSLLGTNGTQFSITGSTANNLTDKLVFGIDTADHYGVIQTGNSSSQTAYNLALNPAGGNIGIGTTTPSYKMDMYSTSTTGSDLRVRNDFLNTGNAVYLSSTSNTLSTGSLLALDWSPGFSVLGTGDLFSINMGANALGSNLLNLKDNGTSIFSVSQTGVTIGIPTSFTSAGDVSVSYDLNFTNPTASFIKSNAPLSIIAGETFNSSNLTLGTYNNGSIVLDTVGGGGVTLNQFQSWTLNNSSTMAWNVVNSASSTLMSFDTTNTRVGIGRTGPGQTLAVFGNVGIGNSFGKLAAPANGLIVEGNIGIGASTSSNKLDVWGASRLTGSITNDQLAGTGTRAVNSTANGVLTNAASDIRLKTNIQTISDRTDVLSSLDKLRGVYFKWDQNNPAAAIFGTQEELGMIAQEVETVLPDLVGTNANGYKSLNYAQFTGYLVEVAKAQQKEINDLIAKQATSSGLLTDLSVSSDGTINAPKLSTNQLIISADINFATTDLNTLINNMGGPGVTGNTTGGYNIDVLASLNSISTAVLGVQSKEASNSATLASLQESVASTSANLNAAIASQSAQLAHNQAQVASNSATLAELQAQIASLSAQIASNSATPSAITTYSPQPTTSLDLTPPTVLLATTSAQLVNLTVTSDATVSGQLTAYDLNIQNGLKSLGKTTLGTTLVAGDLTVDGTMSIKGDSINSLSTLYLQNNPFSDSVDLFNGKVIVDSSGNLTTQGTITAAQITTNKLTISNTSTSLSTGTPVASGSGTLAASIGTTTIPAGALQVPIYTTAVTDKSKIFLTPVTPTNGQALVAYYQESGLGFVVSLDHIIDQDIKFNWWIVDTQ